MSTAADIRTVSDEDRLRADLYNFLGVLLSAPPDQMLLDQAAALTGDDSPLGQGITALARTARTTRPKTVTREFNALFIGLGRGELLPYASYYLTGFLNEKPLAALRRDMSLRGLARSDTVFEPEDNIASLMEMMAAMIAGRFGAPAPLADQKTFFGRHIAPWAGHFFSDLEGARNSVFYAAVGTVGRAFMDIEGEAFRLSGA
ncbi:MAG: molecular chaperone TorD [Rhodobacteraceae bacterium]|nr:molecular chaperone TorD [Paracoccaceae bacterium]QEW19689.1 chaperone protein TorD [Marinibacterium anthonyi]